MNFIKKATPIAASLLGIAAIVMIFCTALVGREDASLTYNGWQIAFGYAVKEYNVQGNGVLSIPVFNFSFFNLFPYILVLVGIAISVLLFFDKGNKFLFWVAVAAFAIAAVFFFLTWVFASMEPVWGPVYSELLGLPTGEYEIVTTSEELKSQLTLGVGPIVAGICATLAACAAATPFFIEKFFE